MSSAAFPGAVRDACAPPRSPSFGVSHTPAAKADSTATAGLVLAAQAGDRAAFGALYESHARLVHGVLLANADRGDVQDLVQDVFLTALQQLPSLRDANAFGGWLIAIARNRARMHHRGTRPTELLSEEMPGSEKAESRVETAEILRALQTLPERYREPLTLRLVEEMSGEEISRFTGLTHGTVRVYLHHGLKLLRDKLGGRDG